MNKFWYKSKDVNQHNFLFVLCYCDIFFKVAVDIHFFFKFSAWEVRPGIYIGSSVRLFFRNSTPLPTKINI